ncbi:MAG: AMP-binding protein [Gammaproteobacteria bacterium]|nr:AMP-binding protein [Gammaproteobacteria bacterium]
MELFASKLRDYANNIAVVSDSGKTLNYHQLADKVDARCKEIGERRKLILVETANEIEPLVAYLAALIGNHPVILVESGATAKDSRIANTFNPEVTFLKKNGEWQFVHQHSSETTNLHPELCVLLSTSGSTGSAKLVRLSKNNIQSNADAIVEYLELSEQQKAITTLSFHYSYGMSIINSHLSVGATLLLTDDSVSQTSFWDFFHQQQATSFSGVPYTFELLQRINFTEKSYPSLQYIAQAGGRLSEDLIKEYGQWSEDHGKKFFVMYGQTEASPRMAYLPPELLNSNSDCIGIPIPGGKFKLSSNDGEEITSPNMSGELVYSGPNVMMGYANSIEDLALDSQLNELKTGDLAEVNEHGLYKIVGRKSRFSKIYGLRISLDELEIFLNKYGFTTVVTGNDDQLVIATLQKNCSEKIGELMQDRYKISPSSYTILELDELPLLSSGKVNYRELISIGEKDAADSSDFQSLLEAYSQIMGNQDIRASDCFLNLGGDSLFFIEISLVIEQKLGFLPDNWEAIAIEDLDKISQGSYGQVKTTTSNAKPWLILTFVLLFFVVGELFLQVRSYLMTGRSAFSLLDDNSTVIENKEIDVSTYRPNLKIINPENESVRISINSVGLRSPEISPTLMENESRIAIVGASTVMGAYAETNENTFPYLLSNQLKEIIDNPVNVINAGIEGHSVSDSLKLVEGIIYDLNPTMIIVYPGFNDITTLCNANNETGSKVYSLPYLQLPNWIQSKEMIRKNTLFVRDHKNSRFNSLNPNDVDPSAYRNDIEKLVVSIKQQGITPVLATVARSFNNVEPELKNELAVSALYFYHCLDLEGLLAITDLYNQQIRKVAEKHDILLIDASRSMPGGNKYFVDAGHFTLTGEQKMAKIIFDAVSDRLKSN